jgi:hypothetical protein
VQQDKYLLMMVKLEIIGRNILLFFVIILVLLTIWSSGDCLNEFHDKKRQANGLVIEKFIDSTVHNTYSLRLNNDMLYRLVGFNNLRGGNSLVYDSLILGDSLIKEKGSLDLVIVRGDQRMVFTHDTGCDENWWKFWKKLKF